MSFQYGNALAEQKRYTDFRVQLLISDLNRLTSGKEPVAILGNAGKSPIVKRMIKKRPILNRLVPSTLGEGYWNQIYLFNYFGIKNKPWNIEGKELKKIKLSTLMVSQYHTIKSDGKHIAVFLEDNKYPFNMTHAE